MNLVRLQLAYDRIRPSLCENVVTEFLREVVIKRFIEGVGRDQGILFPERLDDFIAENNLVRVV